MSGVAKSTRRSMHAGVRIQDASVRSYGCISPRFKKHMTDAACFYYAYHTTLSTLYILKLSRCLIAPYNLLRVVQDGD